MFVIPMFVRVLSVPTNQEHRYFSDIRAPVHVLKTSGLQGEERTKQLAMHHLAAGFQVTRYTYGCSSVHNCAVAIG
jgi:hypothetical protein